MKFQLSPTPLLNGPAPIRLSRIIAFVSGLGALGVSVYLLTTTDPLGERINRGTILFIILCNLVILATAWHPIGGESLPYFWAGINILQSCSIFVTPTIIPFLLFVCILLVFMAVIIWLIFQSEEKRKLSVRNGIKPPQSTQVSPSTSPVEQLSSLTTREYEILQLLAEGKQNKEIADALLISPNTVRRHVHEILRKLNVPNRAQAANLARNVKLK